MLEELHFLRPLWWFAILPILLLGFSILKQNKATKNWFKVCDKHLLPYLLKTHGRSSIFWPFFTLMGSAICMVIALTGPTWSKIEVPTYKQIRPRIILLDMSEEMWQKDLSPSRLDRAKFKLHDLLQHKDAGQFGLIVYTSEPFVVSPLTEDSQTIDALLASLNKDVMPIAGNKLASAILNAKTLLSASGQKFGDILILTSTLPSKDAVSAANQVLRSGLRVSVIPMLLNQESNIYFQPLVKAGGGKVIALTNDDKDIKQWLQLTNIKSDFQVSNLNNISLWHDEGRWFILLALLFLLPLFWRGWLERISI